MGTNRHSTINRPVLVLNKNWIPIHITPLSEAICKVCSSEPRARIVNPPDFQLYNWEDWASLIPEPGEDTLNGICRKFKIPEVILLSYFCKFPARRVTFSRRHLFQRDNFTCCYCGKQPGTKELTIDHVIPKSRFEGKSHTSFLNCVLACVSCNSKKANKTPEEAGMKLLRKPFEPKLDFFKFQVSKPIKSWNGFISEMYWNIELRD